VPRISGIAHIELSVRDRDASVDFYRDVLGFREFHTADTNRWLRTLCRHPCGLVLSITQHRDHFNALFDPRHVGVDHVAFRVSVPGQLSAWEDRLSDMDVDHAPVIRTAFGSVLAFTDPDGIQLELFCPAEDEESANARPGDDTNEESAQARSGDDAGPSQ
jgi:glyoxylase I family protein